MAKRSMTTTIDRSQMELLARYVGEQDRIRANMRGRLYDNCLAMQADWRAFQAKLASGGEYESLAGQFTEDIKGITDLAEIGRILGAMGIIIDAMRDIETRAPGFFGIDWPPPEPPIPVAPPEEGRL